MEAKPRKVHFYQTVEGKRPFEEWLLHLKDAQAQVVIRKRLVTVEGGSFGSAGPVGDNVHELRVDFGPGYRVYFGEDGDVLVIILCGGQKRGQQRDIDQAQKFWADYNKRKPKKKGGHDGKDNQ